MATNTQLLHCIRNSVNKANNTDDQGERKTLLDAVDQILSLMLTRQDEKFYIDHYQQGYQLLQKGAGLVEGLGLVEVAAIVPADNQLSEILEAGLAADTYENEIETMAGALTAIVSAMPASGKQEIVVYLDAVTNWETAFYAKRLEPVPLPEQNIVPEVQIEKAAFENYLRQKFPAWKNLQIKTFNQLPGGFSKNTILVETQDDLNGVQSMVIRAMQASYICKLHAFEIVDEYPIVKLAYEAGLPVAEPLWLETDKTLLGTQFIVSRKAAGRVSGSAIGPTEPITESMMQNMIETMVKVHSVSLKQYEQQIRQSKILSKWYPLKTVAEANRARNEYWYNLAEEVGALSSPLIMRAFRWLEENIEPCVEPPALIHGDFGLHNILIEKNKVTALLDWEVAHIGDPAMELSWVYLCTGKQFDVKELLEKYRRAGGRTLSEYSFYYQQVFHCIMMPITCIAAKNLLNTRLDNIQYANFGLLFMHYNTSYLNTAIALAEAARR